jgi:hypothetical protein
MKHESFFSSTCWALAVAAMAPLVIGTQFLNAPAKADGPDWSNPCIEEPESPQCAHFTQYVSVHKALWSAAWGTPYVHGLSFMSASPPTPGATAYQIDVWHNSELDYNDPNLTEQDILGQIVATGSLEPEIVAYLTSSIEVFVDPQDGAVTTVDVTAHTIGGVLVGEAGIQLPLAGVLLVAQLANTHGQQQTVRLFNVIKTFRKVEDAVAMAGALSALFNEQTSGGGGWPKPGSPLGWTLPSGPQNWQYLCNDAPEACCLCAATLNQELNQCKSDFVGQGLGCWGAVGGFELALAIAACALVCGGTFGFGCFACLLIAFATIGTSVAVCLSYIGGIYETCVQDAYNMFHLCWALNNCPPLP